MTEEKEQKKIKAADVAYCGMAAALSVVILALSAIIPVLTYAAPLLVAALLVPLRKQFGRKMAVLTWITVSLLVFFLGADREAAFFYIFFGHYPLTKELLDRCKIKWLVFIGKILLFTALSVLMYWILIAVLGLSELASEKMWMDIVFLVMLVAVMMLYDRLLNRIVQIRFQRLFRRI